MKRLHFFLLIAIVVSTAIILVGCSSSSETSKEGQDATTQPPAPKTTVTQTSKTEQPVPPKGDTVSVEVQNTSKPAYQPQKLSPATPTGKFSVQIGAYKMPDNADRIAALARERWSRPVYTLQDKTDSLYKVMIGDFTTKDDARKFRDEMVQQFPADYKDAWVSENPEK